MVHVRQIHVGRGTQPNSKFYHVNDGWHYNKNCIKKGVIYLKCVRYERGCPGRALYDRRRGFIHTKRHDHPRNRLYVPYMRLRRNILQRCRRLEFVSFRQIIVEESRGFPLRVQALLRMSHIRSSMQRVRYRRFPPVPASLEELTRILQNPLYAVMTATHDAEDSLYAASVTARDGSHSVLFMTRRMANVARSMHTLFADGTFKSLPSIEGLNRASQVFALVGNWNHTIIPLGWAVMQRRTTPAYESVLRILRLILRNAPNLRRIITDFEPGMRRAWSNIFPDVHLQGCFFHFVRALISYAKEELNMALLLRREPYSELMKSYCSLALLPRRFIRRGYNLLVQETRQHGGRVYGRMRPFLAYLLRSWVAHPVKRPWMCVYGSIHRTNNTCESHNKMLGNFACVPHPNTYNFISALASMEENALADVEALELGEQPNRRRKLKSIILDRRLRNLAETLNNPPGNLDQAILRYIHAASHTFDTAYRNAVEGN
ncbi:uncharacterized protein LOC117652588 [Thrips palmi]|uniref:Uncharacterized protein LOC117652588 n=1 Tax=Thrips palmi TaxID=161013 RepID=A0A6P9A7I7_THRPL|nr:uncharacterized protein LOC117652588 [Thrips palmi]